MAHDQVRFVAGPLVGEDSGTAAEPQHALVVQHHHLVALRGIRCQKQIKREQYALVGRGTAQLF